MNCQNCRHQKRGLLSLLGFHGCALAPRWESFAPMYSCEKHLPESKEARAARLAESKIGKK